MEPRLASPPLDSTPVPTPLHSPLLPPVVGAAALSRVGPDSPNYVLHYAYDEGFENDLIEFVPASRSCSSERWVD